MTGTSRERRISRGSCKMALGAAVALTLGASSAQALDLDDFVQYSEGYVNVRPNVVMIEGPEDIRVCHFGMTEAFFTAYADQDEAALNAARPNVICVPLRAVSAVAHDDGPRSGNQLYRFVDESEGYEQVMPNVVMVEGETAIRFCHFRMTDAFFAAYAANDMAGVEANQPTVTCVPMEEVAR